jgi:uncharacterized OB-fold protein
MTTVRPSEPQPSEPQPFVVPSADTVVLGAPLPDPFTQTYWDALAKHRLLVRRCGSCGSAFHPPRPVCPVCWSASVEWEQVSGRGTIYTYSVIRENDLPMYRPAVPYVVAIVELDVGARFMTQIIDSPSTAVVIDAPVEVQFVERDGFTHPLFSTVAR